MFYMRNIFDNENNAFAIIECERCMFLVELTNTNYIKLLKSLSSRNFTIKSSDSKSNDNNTLNDLN